MRGGWGCDGEEEGRRPRGLYVPGSLAGGDTPLKKKASVVGLQRGCDQGLGGQVGLRAGQDLPGNIKSLDH